MIKSITPLLCFCFLAFSARAQKLENLRTSFDGEKVIAQYDLTCNDPTQLFKVSLYSSHNNYTQPLTPVSGDVGEHVIPGKDRKIVWEARNSLPGDFDQEIFIKLKTSIATSVTPAKGEGSSALRIKSFDRNFYKKGKTLELQWSGGKSNDMINIELLKHGEAKQKIVTNLANAHKYSWKVPKKGEHGKGYSLRVSSAGKPGEFSSSSNFSIKPRISLGVKTLPVVVAAVVFLMLDGKEGDVLPGPIKP